MKLRNNTHFRVNFLHNDLANMVLTVNLSLNDLHIVGAYERMIYYKDWTKLFYAPTFGEVEFLLRNVQYTAEGRYRLLRDKLWIELIVSDLDVSDIVIMFINKQKENKPFPFETNVVGLLNLLKINLDKWLKDYINDNLMYYAGNKASANFLKYNQEKTIALNEYADYVLEKINKRVHLKGQTVWSAPKFNIKAINGVKIIFHWTKYKNYHRIYRRSFATCKKDGKLRKIDTIVGLSNLEVYIEYEAVTHTGKVLKEYIVVSVDEIIAHMGVTLTKDPETFEIRLDSIQHIK
ncbi:unnamed protein product [Parnassius mnemosyne]|uniref:Uncharacterized protein n=1 Tax=Parnassius mnemosyne TaxID=213953 RepID=A0AAV1KF73_9NEOP